jgi:hypothetical protein
VVVNRDRDYRQMREIMKNLAKNTREVVESSQALKRDLETVHTLSLMHIVVVTMKTSKTYVYV